MSLKNILAFAVCVFVFQLSLFAGDGSHSISLNPTVKAQSLKSDRYDSIKILSGHGVMPTKCSGELHGGLCKGSFYLDIRFKSEFEQVPHVIVTPEQVSSQAGCVGNTTDTVVSHPTRITKSGFRLWGNGSPAAGCGSYDGMSSLAKFGWIAIDLSSDKSKQDFTSSVVEPPICLGRNRALQWDGFEWICRRLRNSQF